MEAAVAINFPPWVTDDTAIPVNFLPRAKRLVYLFIAIEKLRILHNAGWKWFRGDPLDADEETLLADAFPDLWPTPPTEAQVRNWLENWWEPRSHECQRMRTVYRRAVVPAEFNVVNLNGLI